MKIKYQELKKNFKGQVLTDNTTKALYATDASAYRELPMAVAFPIDDEDLKQLILFANKNEVPLIPRTAGTSLAGQVVGNGIVVDVSRYFTNILEVNTEERWVRVQPGVIRDELNMYLKKYELFFGPETSTANRAMIGGMVGNNSCGANSLIYGSTRDHLLEIKGLLSDGSEVTFSGLDLKEFNAKCEQTNLEGGLYKNIKSILEKDENKNSISREFPKPSITRRNTGYAIDLLLQTAPFEGNKEKFNFCKLIAGSEGTLVFITEIKVKTIPPPPPENCLVCIHYKSVHEALKANLVALKHSPTAVELMDHYILECTKENIEQRENRFFVYGDPRALLIIELKAESQEQLSAKAEALVQDMKSNNMGYHFPIVTGEKTKRVWALRKAGLGLLSNLPGDSKPAPVIEDTAVDVEDLPSYIQEFNTILDKYGMYCVHYAHAGSGELHLRPILNLKTDEGNRLFRAILEEIAILVKKYRGSLSGEHGDGRLRGEFIPFMIGEHNYNLLKQIKKVWDPKGIFNPGKIVGTPAMNTSLRYVPGQKTPAFDTILDFSKNKGVLRAAEQCNGSGDCRKTHLTGGVMCPSYMATKNEKDTTRARANILREVLTNNKNSNAFDNESIKEVMDLCLSCKGCKAECPSNVDVAKLKSEFLYQYQQANGTSLRTKMVANFTTLNKLATKAPAFYKLGMQSPLSRFTKSVIGFHTKRSMPGLSKTTLSAWYKKNYQPPANPVKTIYLFCDEFTEYNDGQIGITAVNLLTRLGYAVEMVKHEESGRTFISKGLLKHARHLANKNISIFSGLISADKPLIGIEPSAILTFRDEYIDLTRDKMQVKAQALSQHVFTIDEFLAAELPTLNKGLFTKEKRLIKLHSHCYQKALSSQVHTKKILSLPENYTVQIIPSGCCGMAGSFGYEKEHYKISMQIGELVLFPTVRSQPDDVIIAAPGTSCRHQIKDGTGKQARHPIEILYLALN